MTARAVLATESLVSQPLELRFAGLPPETLIQVHARFTDDAGTTWHSEITVRSDGLGTVDLNTQAPEHGSYSGVDPNGLLWSMRPQTTLDDEAFRVAGAAGEQDGPSGHRMGLPHLVGDGPLTLLVEAGENQPGRPLAVLASATQVRHRFPEGVRETKVSDGAVRGAVFAPADVEDPTPGVVLLAGSGGGIYREQAAQLASHGLTVLALGYFNHADLPRFHHGVDLSYFREALEWFQGHLGHDRIGITGASKGGEAALVVAAEYPHVVRACAPVVGGDLYVGGSDDVGTMAAAWTRDGEAIPWACTPQDALLVGEELRLPAEGRLYNMRLAMEGWYFDADVYQRAAIPVERIICPVLFLSAGDDQSWPSYEASERALARIRHHNPSAPVRHVSIADAGHLLTMPGYPTTLTARGLHPLLPLFFTLGGTPAATAQMQRRMWQERITFFDNVLGT